jgi:hypothetical protein
LTQSQDGMMKTLHLKVFSPKPYSNCFHVSLSSRQIFGYHSSCVDGPALSRQYT